MNRRFSSAVIVLLLVVVPASASQFVRLPFDQVAREAAFVARGTLGPVTSAWDDAHEVIYSTAVLQVNHYFGGSGPATLLVREVGGTVGGYTQEAIGFPVLREGEQVVLFLSQWEDGADYRIHAYNQGKYLVRAMQRGGESLVPDPVQQGDARLTPGLHAAQPDQVDDGLDVNEFAAMVRAARQPVDITPRSRQ